jgi:hypothetical protein
MLKFGKLKAETRVFGNKSFSPMMAGERAWTEVNSPPTPRGYRKKSSQLFSQIFFSLFALGP